MIPAETSVHKYPNTHTPPTNALAPGVTCCVPRFSEKLARAEGRNEGRRRKSAEKKAVRPRRISPAERKPPEVRMSFRVMEIVNPGKSAEACVIASFSSALRSWRALGE